MNGLFFHWNRICSQMFHCYVGLHHVASSKNILDFQGPYVSFKLLQVMLGQESHWKNTVSVCTWDFHVQQQTQLSNMQNQWHCIVLIRDVSKLFALITSSFRQRKMVMAIFNTSFFSQGPKNRNYLFLWFQYKFNTNLGYKFNRI